MYNEFLTAIARFPAVFSASECQRIIDIPLPFGAAGIELRDRDEAATATSRVDYGVRRTNVKSLPPTDEYLWVFHRVASVVGPANHNTWRFQLNGEMSVDVLEYDPAGYFDWHVDLGPGIFAGRKLSIVVFLTPPEDYDGGNLCFMDGGEPLRLAQGTMVIFPSFLLHKVEPVTRGTRYTLVCWAHGPSFT